MQQSCMHDYERAVENEHLHMNRNDRNTNANFKTQNTLAVPKTRQSRHTYLFLILLNVFIEVMPSVL